MAASLPFLLLTRPRASSEQFLRQLEGDEVTGFVPILSPALTIKPILPAPKLPQGAGLILTSANAVAAYRALGGRPVAPCFVVGPATAEAARAEGFDPISADGNADDLVALILGMAPDLAPDAKLVHLHGTHTRGNVVERLRRGGVMAEGLAIYDQPAQELSDLAQQALKGALPVVLPLFSPRSAAQVTKACRAADAPLFVAAMSAQVSLALDGIYLQGLDIPKRPDGRLMRQSVGKLLKMAATLVEDRGSVKG